MNDREQMLEAAIDLLAEAVIILDTDSTALFWNGTAAELTGYPAALVLGRRCPADLYTVDQEHLFKIGPRHEARHRVAHARAAELTACTCASAQTFSQTSAQTSASSLLLDAPPDTDGETPDLLHPTLVSLRHRLGHAIPAMLRRIAISDAFGRRIGASLLFHAVEDPGALPHGDAAEGPAIERSQAEMEDRLDAVYHQWLDSEIPFGILWITVDQAHTLRHSHGRDACEAMMRTVEQTLLRQMKPSEVLGRWGDNEYLVLTHERTPELLLEHARRLLSLARTADFRWWGDRAALTASIGLSHATPGDTLQSLLARAQQSMQASEYAGGNRITEGRQR